MVRLNEVGRSMFAQTLAATHVGEREGNRFPSLLRLVPLLNHNLPENRATEVGFGGEGGGGSVCGGGYDLAGVLGAGVACAKDALC